MDSLRKMSVLLVWAMIFVTGNHGQSEENLKRLCELCWTDSLKICHSNDSIEMKTTINCIHPRQFCLLEMDEQVFNTYDSISDEACRLTQTFPVLINVNISVVFSENGIVRIFRSKNERALLSSLTKFVKRDLSVQVTEYPDDLDLATDLVARTETSANHDSPAESAKINIETIDEGSKEIIEIASRNFPGFRSPEIDSTDLNSEISGSRILSSLNDQGSVEHVSTLSAEPDSEPGEEVMEMGPTPSPKSEGLQDENYQGDDSKLTSKETGSEMISNRSEDGLSCFSCSSCSEVKDACLLVGDDMKIVDCPKANGCVTYYNGGCIIRGCASSLPEDDLKRCEASKNFTCQLCQDDKCNNIIWKQCHQCDSRTDHDCAQWTTVETIPTEACSLYNDHCVVRITEDGDTIRQCVSKDDIQCTHTDLCSVCNESLCNFGIFPSNRRQCIQCGDCDDEKNSYEPKPCIGFDPEDQCFQYLTANHKLIRDCTSNADAMKECKSGGSGCMLCGEHNGCNSTFLLKDPTLSCIKCDSKTDETCAWYQSPTLAVKCVNKVLSHASETCMSKYDPETKEIVRGCSNDDGQCNPGDTSCNACDVNGCNVGNLQIQECIQCSSMNESQPSCGRNAEGIPSTKCPKEIQLYDFRGCYLLKRENVIVRGCLSDLSQIILPQCRMGRVTQKDFCIHCLEAGCNNQTVSSSARLGREYAVLTVGISACVFLNNILIQAGGYWKY